MKTNALLIVLLLVSGGGLAATMFLVAQRGDAPSAGADARLAAIEERLTVLEQVAVETRESARRAARAAGAARVREAPTSAGTSSAADGATGGTAGGSDPGDIERAVKDSVQRSVAEQMELLAAQGRNRGADGKWKPPLDEMARVLDLGEEQSKALTRIFDGARDESFALLSTERADGGSLLDDFARDLREEKDPRAAYARLFGALTSKNVPGQSRTYLEAFGEVEKRVKKSVSATIGESRAKRFDSLNVDVFEVQTGYDPVGDYVRERLNESAR